MTLPETGLVNVAEHPASRRWLVTFDDGVHEAATPGEALEKAAEADSVPVGATVFVIDLDAIEGTDSCRRMRLGGYEIGNGDA